MAVLLNGMISVRRATATTTQSSIWVTISIHALREESDAGSHARRRQHLISIHALREESDRELRAKHMTQRISIHALREESDLAERRQRPAVFISIHALREESDRARCRPYAARQHFNPRSP